MSNEAHAGESSTTTPGPARLRGADAAGRQVHHLPDGRGGAAGADVLAGRDAQLARADDRGAPLAAGQDQTSVGIEESAVPRTQTQREATHHRGHAGMYGHRGGI